MLRGDQPAITVVVPVRDNAAGIRELLARLEVQTIGRDAFEVIVGDDGSRGQPLGDPAAGNGRVRVSRGPRLTSYAARNRAARLARSPALAFCDSDCLPEPTWLEAGLAALERADVVAGEVRFVPPSRPTAWTLLTADMFLDQQLNVRIGRGVTANLFVRRELFQRLGGFDESFPSGGDYDLVARAVTAGGRLVYSPDAVVRHPTMNSAGPFLRKVWTTNRCSAARSAQAGDRPDFAAAFSALVPVLGVSVARRRARRPALRLHRSRLAAAGLDARPVAAARAVFALYIVVAYVGGLARILGWLAPGSVYVGGS